MNSPGLKPSLRLPHITALYIGAVLGSGILIVPGLAAELAGPASLIAWGLMAVVVLPMALTIGMLSAKYPNAGGVSHFVSRAYNANIGSLIGWYFLMSVGVGAPVLALTGAGYLSSALGLSETFRIGFAAAILAAGLIINYYGMKITGRIQIAVVLITIFILAVAIAGSIGKVESSNFLPFVPNGWLSVGQSETILFWCFLGWEAISHISEEFKNPEVDAVRGAVIAALTISVIYFITAFVVVGTHSYGPGSSDVSLLHIIKSSFGTWGAIIGGFAALLICLAPAIAYIGAVSRLAYSLSLNGYAPKQLSYISKKYNTPTGGLFFLAIFFLLVLAVYSCGIISISVLIQIPNATFILTYLAGSAAGVRLLRGTPFGVTISIISLVLTLVIFTFVGWAVLYPVVITILWFCFIIVEKKFYAEKAE